MLGIWRASIKHVLNATHRDSLRYMQSAPWRRMRSPHGRRFSIMVYNEIREEPQHIMIPVTPSRCVETSQLDQDLLFEIL